MHLKEIEIYGFKSFPKKTALKFEPGIAVIVGPNGCGKSNVLDAIRWALGEQSPKSLRGSKMEDIIFNGTEKDSPLNYAEVTLTFCNEDRALNIEFSEVSITRKLFRSGDSEYYLNKGLTRLKDIQSLLLSVGLGEGSYSFVAQGSIENILTSKPEEKRVIFDEASGILRFKERKREVLRKLAEVDNNLTRLEDIINEVGRQRDSLGRQVQRAKRYREIQDQLKEVEKSIAAVKIRDLKSKKDTHIKELSDLDQKDQAQESAIKEKRLQANAKNIEFAGLKKDSEENSSRIVILTSGTASNQHLIEVNDQRIIELSQRLEAVNSSQSTQTQRIEERKVRIETLKQELEEAAKTCGDNKIRVDEYSQAIEVKSGENKAKAHFIKDSNSAVLGFEEERTTASNELIDIQSQLATFSSRKKRLLLEEAKSDSEFSEFQARSSELQEKIRIIDTEARSLGRDFSQYVEVIKKHEKNIHDLSLERIEKEKEILLLTSQLEFLQDLRVRYDDFPDTHRVTIVLEDDIFSVPSVIVAKIDASTQKERDQQGFKVTTQAKVFSQSVEQFQNKIVNAKAELSQIEGNIARLQEDNLAAGDKRRQAEERLKSKENDLLRLRESANSLNENLSRLKEEKDLVLFELKEAEQEISSQSVKEKGLKERLFEKETQLKEIQASISEADTLIRRNEEDINDLKIQITRLNTESLSLEEEKKAKNQTLGVFAQDLESAGRELETLKKETIDIHNKMTLTGQETRSLKLKIEATLKDIEALKDIALKLKAKEDEYTSEQRKFAEGIEVLQVEAEDIRKTIYDKKLSLQNVAFDEERVITDLRQLYEVEVEADEVSLRDVEVPLEQLLKDEEDFKRRLKYLGNVNLSALDEYEELNQRFEFLTRQKEDLLSSKDSLKKAIGKINKTSRDMFLEVFTRIQEEFRKTFRFLFGGGKAEIYLLDEEDVLESGIEMVVQPPEKKLQNVTLLSGGEKSLTAVALIFSIFKVKPSPLCILDEIDAPLDESNVDRFNHLLSDFAKRSQFLIISHNKKTISRADVMYGVTMQESGISKIVSVKFQESSQAAVSS